MSYPPFPPDLPVHDLLVVDLKLLREGDQAQADILWKAATTWGFWYLKNHEGVKYTEPMFEMGRKTLDLPFDEKMKYWQGGEGGSAGYRPAGSRYTDADGSVDLTEFINVAKDDAIAYPKVVHTSYPPTVNEYIEGTIRPYTQSCLESCEVIMNVFNDKLGLPKDTLQDLHRPEKKCQSESRCIKVPPVEKPTKIALGAHTDFGSLSFLVNQIGGLQVRVMNGDQEEWKYVKPIPGYMICNIGDTLSILSGGILKSAMHRVLPPPGAQAGYERWSLVYFCRPADDVFLDPLSDKSTLIADTLKTSGQEKTAFSPGMTAAQWLVKRQLQYRPDTFKN
ncbi:hypothetical protein D9613_003836 [Agrocybe pediades]|uniref:Fe2OG dioxygenase domain-containing protein n=1 Tax=Agrocybe pediades TaxID=84607 RepID=A0A8H4QIS5_9AGAR|nr:hypothetical protein D9613_003836 [Agrocybe pediades]